MDDQKNKCNCFIVKFVLVEHLTRISVFALTTSTAGKSKDRSNPLEDLDEAEQLLEWIKVELERGQLLREGESNNQDFGAEEGD